MIVPAALNSYVIILSAPPQRERRSMIVGLEEPEPEITRLPIIAWYVQLDADPVPIGPFGPYLDVPAVEVGGAIVKDPEYMEKALDYEEIEGI